MSSKSVYQESSYFYVGDRTFLSALLYLIQREMDECVKHGESMVTIKYISMAHVVGEIKHFLNQLACVVGGDDPRLDHLSSDVDDLIKNVVLKHKEFWGHYLIREVDDLLRSRTNERRVEEVIKEIREEKKPENADSLKPVPAAAAAAAVAVDDDDDVIIEPVKRPGKPLVEIEDLESEE